MSVIDDLLKKAKPATAAMKLCLDGSLMGRIDLINDALSDLSDWKPASMSDPDPRTPLRAELDQLHEQARDPERCQEFHFQSLGDHEWADLLAAHPARKDNDDDGAWDSSTFPAALVAASSVEPKLSVTDVQRLWGVLNGWQRDQLFTTAYSANRRVVDIPFSPSSSAGEASSANN